MDVNKISKAIAGGIASLVGSWVAALWGFEIPADTLTWGTTVLTSVISAGLGFAVTYISPKNAD